MKMGDYIVYRYRNTVRVGKWLGITKNRRAIIKSLEKGNTTYLIRNMNLILSVEDICSKYGLKTAEMGLTAKKRGRPLSATTPAIKRL